MRWIPLLLLLGCMAQQEPQAGSASPIQTQVKGTEALNSSTPKPSQPAYLNLGLVPAGAALSGPAPVVLAPKAPPPPSILPPTKHERPVGYKASSPKHTGRSRDVVREVSGEEIRAPQQALEHFKHLEKKKKKAKDSKQDAERKARRQAGMRARYQAGLKQRGAEELRRSSERVMRRVERKRQAAEKAARRQALRERVKENSILGLVADKDGSTKRLLDGDLKFDFAAHLEAKPNPKKPNSKKKESKAEEQREIPNAISGADDLSVYRYQLQDGEAELAQEEQEPEEPEPSLQPLDEGQPLSFLPRVFYFENSYLGGNAAYLERLRRLDTELSQRPYRLAQLPPQSFDPPRKMGLSLSAQLDRGWINHPRRLILQVGLQGSQRFGWRRPPLDLLLFLDGLPRSEEVLKAGMALLPHLGPQDRLQISLGSCLLVPLNAPHIVRQALIRASELGCPQRLSHEALEGALLKAGGLLDAQGAGSRVPGARSLILLSRSGAPRRVEAARRAAHALQLKGIVSSVIELGQTGGDWWAVANAGHGNFHRSIDLEGGLDRSLTAELESLSKVIARLLRINIRLAPQVEAIRVLGSRVLKAEEVAEVKAREVATDQNLSKSLGLKADRGEDDDGIQTVIPYFYGGDAHVILVELWAEKPGPVANVSLRYKDMVRLENSSAQVSVSLSSLPQRPSPLERTVVQNHRGFSFAEGLGLAAQALNQGRWREAQRQLRTSQTWASPEDLKVLRGFEALLNEPRWRARPQILSEALSLAAQRRIGEGG